MMPARREGRVDVVRDLAERVPTELSARYFKAPSPQGDRLMRWSQAVFREFFYNIRNDPAISDPAWESADLLRSHIEGVIGARKAASPARLRHLRMCWAACSSSKPKVSPASTTSGSGSTSPA